nr:E3 ubiquitin-protein ligase RNF144B isoform X2 [Nerophis lumbriciformis]
MNSTTYADSEPGACISADPGPGPDVFCKLCLSKHTLALTTTLHSCRCIFCTTCLQQYVELVIKEGGGEPVTCPDMDCRNMGVLLETEIDDLASADQAEMYQRLKFERGVSLDPSKTWCPLFDCQAVCTMQLSSEGQAVAVPCPTCHTIFCSECKVPWQGGHTCSELQPMMSHSNESSLSELPIKQCPKCGIYIERNQGCAQMVCKCCKHIFCWHCLQSLKGDIFLRHYDKGSCRNKLGHSRAMLMWGRTKDTTSTVSKNNLKCGLVRPQNTFPLCMSPSWMSSSLSGGSPCGGHHCGAGNFSSPPAGLTMYLCCICNP